MALTYDGTNGIFTRLGKLAGLARAVRTHQSDIKTRIASIQGEYSAADSWMVAPLVSAMESRIASAGAILADVQAAMQTTLVEMIQADSLVSTRSVLPDKTVEQSLLYLAREMALDSETVQATTITKAAVGTGTTNTGTGTLLFTELPPIAAYSGVTQYPNIRTERLEIRCVEDAQSGYIKSGSEVFEVRGFVPYGNLDYRFPAGSGTRMRMPCLNPQLDTGGRYENILRNSAFLNFNTTANVPDSWAVGVGTPGTHFAQETTNFYRGASAFKMIGNGATLAKITQTMGSDTGTPGTLVSDRLYCLAIAAKTSGGGAAGVVRVSLRNASTGAVVTGATMDISYSIGSTWAWNYVFFRAPLVLPTSIQAVIEQTTALTAGLSMYLDEMVLAEVRQIAPGGTGLVILPGSKDWVVNDSLRIVATNNAEGDWNTELDRFFQMYERGLLLPAAASPSETILDSLIV